MSASRRRIVVHAVLAAVACAAVGLMLASLGGMWYESQPVARTGPSDAVAAGAAMPTTVADELRWRLPLAMAVLGFAIVVAAEGLLSLWRVAPPPAPPADHAAQAEAAIQKLLAEADRRTTPA